MISKLCIFEDQKYQDLAPLNFVRACYDLRTGFDTLFDKIKAPFPDATLSCFCRPEIQAFVAKEHPNTFINKLNKGSDCLFINGRILMDSILEESIKNIDTSQNALLTYQGQVIAVFARGDELEFMEMALKSPIVSSEIIAHFRKKAICKELSHCRLIQWPWDLIYFNAQTIGNDFKRYNQPGIIKGKVCPFTAIYNENQVFIDQDAYVEDFVVLDARKGPIFICKGAQILAHTRIEGPAYIGNNTHVIAGQITASSIGPDCKIAGEVSHCVFQRFSNKAHNGFLGHSFVGEWVNLGANTCTSNLKANYKNIKVTKELKETNTGLQFLGAIIADHVKTSINTMLNTGSMISFAATLLDTGFHSKYVAPFSWGKANNYELIKLNSFLETASLMMQRRGETLSEAQSDCLSKLHEEAKNKLTYKHVLKA
ncbi:MAG: putative sugar nucleotidyl transferase [bacterium]